MKEVKEPLGWSPQLILFTAVGNESAEGLCCLLGRLEAERHGPVGWQGLFSQHSLTAWCLF